MKPWTDCKRILCIRLDNMGDVLMSAPAFSALKKTFDCHITVLTSARGKGITAYIPAVDAAIEWEAPWVSNAGESSPTDFNEMVAVLKRGNFDAAIIFTVFSQNPLPSALMTALAGISRRLAYCRENPYELLSDWIPDKEPYTFLRHQTRRDLDLVKSIGADTKEEKISLRTSTAFDLSLRQKMQIMNIDLSRPWLIMHPGVSERKREYDADMWIEAGKRITTELGYQIIVTGAKGEKALADSISETIGKYAFSVAGMLSLDELVTLIRFAPLLISVNTGPVHIAAALQTKVIVLYALTNPQHPPWKAIGKILPFSIDDATHSRNEVLQFLQRKYYAQRQCTVTPDEILIAAYELLIEKQEPLVEELVLPFHPHLQGMRNTLNFQEP